MPFDGGDGEYRAVHEGHTYELAWRRGALVLAIDQRPEIANRTLTLQRRWTDQETNVILSIASRGIRDGTPFSELSFPNGDAMQTHPDHRLGPLPTYFSAELVEDFELEWQLRARDHARWYALYDRMVAGFSPTSHRVT